eukprot:562499-Prymnesium_polylepis.1
MSCAGCCPGGTPKEPLAKETECPRMTRKGLLDGRRTRVQLSALGRLDDDQEAVDPKLPC